MMWLWVAAVVALAAVLAFGLRREFARLDEMRRQEALQRFLATNPRMLKLRVDHEALSRQIGERLLPALAQMTAAVNAWSNDPKTQAAMKRLAETMPKPREGRR